MDLTVFFLERAGVQKSSKKVKPSLAVSTEQKFMVKSTFFYFF